MNERDQATIRALLDRQRIFDCLLRYTRGMDRLDQELVISAFHPDASANGGTREELAAAGMAIHGAENRKTHHCLTNHKCELDGDVAYAETYFTYFGAREGGATDVLGGRYVDELERRDGEWRISKRIVLAEWNSSLPIPESEGTGTSASVGGLESQNDSRSKRSSKDAFYLHPLPISVGAS